MIQTLTGTQRHIRFVAWSQEAKSPVAGDDVASGQPNECGRHSDAHGS